MSNFKMYFTLISLLTILVLGCNKKDFRQDSQLLEQESVNDLILDSQNEIENRGPTGPPFVNPCGGPNYPNDPYGILYKAKTEWQCNNYWGTVWQDGVCYWCG